MADVIFVILKMNAVTCFSAIIVLSIRFIMHKLNISRKITFLLWVVIAFRLLCPVSVSTDFSLLNLIPAREAETQKLPDRNGAVQEISIALSDYNVNKEDYVINSSGDDGNLIGIIWLSGVSVMLLFGIFSYLFMKRRIRYAIKYRDNIYIAENIPTPFVFGILKPKIYIPTGTCDETLKFVLLHEGIHIRRKDYITKIFAYIILSIHWFNPINWILFKIFSDDIEFLCDEIAVKETGLENKTKYADAMLEYVTANKSSKVFFCGMSVSSTAVKNRIKHVLKINEKTKLSAAGIIIVALIFVTSCTDRTEYISQTDDITFENEIEYVYYEEEEERNIVSESENDAEMPIASEHESKRETKYTSVASRDAEYEGYIEDNSDELDNTDIYYNDNSLKAGGKYLSGTEDVLYGISCNENGELNLYFDINTETLVDITLVNSETKEEELAFIMPAGGETPYTISDLDHSKKYDIEIQGITKDEWNIEGDYYIY